MLNNTYTNSLIKEYVEFVKPKKVPSLVINQKNRKTAFMGNSQIYENIIIVNILEKENDIQLLFEEISKHLTPNGRLIIIYKNYLQSFFGELIYSLINKKSDNLNWLSSYDIKSFLKLANFDTVSSQPLSLIKLNIPILSAFINKLLIHLFPFNHLAFLQTIVARKINTTIQDHTVTLVIPARNEQGNIEKLFNKLPPIGSKTEVIFIEGHSKDNTLKEINRCIKKYKKSHPHIFKIIKQKGIGKADAVREGFKQAIGEILIIYDSDMSVDPNDINKFYYALITHKGEFINGSRLIYPMQKNAMQFLNILGNKIFSFIYSWLLGQKIKDTLCGTKALWKKDYQKIKTEDFFGIYDPFGDFELLLGAGKLNLKIIDLPIRYFERTYGSTNIKRFKNALELFKFSLIGIKKLKMRI